MEELTDVAPLEIGLNVTEDQDSNLETSTEKEPPMIPQQSPESHDDVFIDNDIDEKDTSAAWRERKKPIERHNDSTRRRVVTYPGGEGGRNYMPKQQQYARTSFSNEEQVHPSVRLQL